MNAPTADPRPPGTRDRRQPEDVYRPTGLLRIALELAVGFALLLLVDRLWLGGHAYVGISPHPYWIPVLLAALLYGSGPGLVAAAIASLLWLFLGAHVFAPGQDYFHYIFRIAKLPLLWVIVALGIGEIALVRQRRLAKLIRREAKYARQVDILSRRYRRLNAINQSLQTRIVTEERTVPRAVAQAIRAAGATHPADLATLIALVAGTGAFTLYRADGDHLTPELHGTAADGRTRPDPALAAALRRRSTLVQIGAPADRPLLDGAGVCALPVRRGVQGPFAGLLLFHDLPPERLTLGGMADLAAIPDWLDRIIGRLWAETP